MGLTARDSGGGDFKKLPPGAHFAICNMVVDCGLQPGSRGKPQHKIYIRWEVPDERVEFKKDGVDVEGPMTIGAFYTLSLGEKAFLRSDLENWRGQAFTEEELKGFDVFKVLGKPCQIMVVHSEPVNGKSYANVKGVMGLSKEQKAFCRQHPERLQPELPLLGYSLETPDPAVFNQLPQWAQEKIKGRIKTEEAATHTDGGSRTEQDFDDDIPF